MSVIDLRKPDYNPADNIIKVINETAKMKQSQNEIQKTLLLDQINRQRNLQDKKAEQDQAWQGAQNWQNKINQMNEVTPNGQANSQTPMKVGDNPTTPIGYGSQLPAYSQDNPPPMSMVDQSKQPQVNSMVFLLE